MSRPILTGLWCLLLLAMPAQAAQLGRLVGSRLQASLRGEKLVHQADMLLRVGERLIGSSDLQAAPALALVSGFARTTTGPAAALDALVFLALWQDEVEPDSDAAQARLKDRAQESWQRLLSAQDATGASHLSAHRSRVLEYLMLQAAFRDYVQRRFTIDAWPPTSSELDRRAGLEDRMRGRVQALGQRKAVEILDRAALQRRVPGWSWSAAVERFLVVGL